MTLAAAENLDGANIEVEPAVAYPALGQRRDGAQRQDQPVEPGLVDPPFQPVAQQRAERLAVADAVQQMQRGPHPGAGQVHGEGVAAGGILVVRQIGAAQDAGRGGMGLGRRRDEAAIRRGRRRRDYTLDPAVGADRDAVRLGRPLRLAALLHHPGQPGVQAVRGEVERLRQRDAQLPRRRPATGGGDQFGEGRLQLGQPAGGVEPVDRRQQPEFCSRMRGAALQRQFAERAGKRLHRLQCRRRRSGDCGGTGGDRGRGLEEARGIDPVRLRRQPLHPVARCRRHQLGREEQQVGQPAAGARLGDGAAGAVPGQHHQRLQHAGDGRALALHDRLDRIGVLGRIDQRQRQGAAFGGERAGAVDQAGVEDHLLQHQVLDEPLHLQVGVGGAGDLGGGLGHVVRQHRPHPKADADRAGAEQFLQHAVDRPAAQMRHVPEIAAPLAAHALQQPHQPGLEAVGAGVPGTEH